jgi:hypothetical protein
MAESDRKRAHCRHDERLLQDLQPDARSPKRNRLKCVVSGPYADGVTSGDVAPQATHRGYGDSRTKIQMAKFSKTALLSG